MPISNSDPKERFSDRVADYVRNRPRYPAAVFDIVVEGAGIGDEAIIDETVVDVGSGTGFLAELFLERGLRVIGVEPNREMREAGDRVLERFERFTSVEGSAEATGLPDAFAGLVLAGQAFHWFEPAATRREFARILRPGGWVALVWNNRLVDTTPFLADYERLLERFGTDYANVVHRNVSASDDSLLLDFFAPAPMHKHVIAMHEQTFDFEGLKGRLLSSSYVPQRGMPGYEPMIAELERIFAAHAVGDRVRFLYDTEIYMGQLPPREDR